MCKNIVFILIFVFKVCVCSSVFSDDDSLASLTKEELREKVFEGNYDAIKEYNKRIDELIAESKLLEKEEQDLEEEESLFSDDRFPILTHEEITRRFEERLEERGHYVPINSLKTFQYNEECKQFMEKAKSLEKEAQNLEDKNKFKDAAKAYEDAASYQKHAVNIFREVESHDKVNRFEKKMSLNLAYSNCMNAKHYELLGDESTNDLYKIASYNTALNYRKKASDLFFKSNHENAQEQELLALNLNKVEKVKERILKEKFNNFSRLQKEKKIYMNPSQGRFVRGKYFGLSSFVIPISGQKGIKLDDIGNNEDKFLEKPWFMQIKKVQRKQRVTLSEEEEEFISFENPIVAFGDDVGGSSLYVDREYAFGVYAGDLFWLDHDSLDDFNNISLLIKVYDKRDFTKRAVNVLPVHEEAITIPLKRHTPNWTTLQNKEMDSFWEKDYLLDSGETFVPQTILTEKYGLETSISYASTYNTWGTGFFDSGLIIKHKSSNDNYYFIVELKGRVYSREHEKVVDLVVNEHFDIPKNKEDFLQTFSSIYALSFSDTLHKSAKHIQRAELYGASKPADHEINSIISEGIKMLTQQLPLTVENINDYKLDHNNSSEAYEHSVLNRLVAEMEKDPIALASYVQNEIELVDAFGFSKDLTDDNLTIVASKINRSALGTFLEKQGSPYEQCALLVYLLRKAGYAAGYVEDNVNGLAMEVDKASQTLGMQLKCFWQLKIEIKRDVKSRILGLQVVV